MSLSEDTKTAAVKCRIKVLNDPMKDGKSWLREVMTQASIFDEQNTITLQWVAVDSVDLTTSTEDKTKQTQKSSVPARGLGILPQVKIENTDSQNDRKTQCQGLP